MPVRSDTETDIESTAGLPPPRFGLRAVFWVVALVAIWLTVWKAIGPVAGLTLLLISMIVTAHVAGSVIGSRLRQRGTQHAVAARKNVTADLQPRSERSAIEPHQFAPVTRLSHRTSLGWFPVAVTILGGALGAIGGGSVLQRAYPDRATVSTLTFGCVATGVLGALFAFWFLSLLQVFLGAWWQAHRHEADSAATRLDGRQPDFGHRNGRSYRPRK